MEKNNKTLNVPPLRFPEFTGEWENLSLNDIVLEKKKRVSSSTLTTSTYISTENMLQNFAGVSKANGVPSNNVVEYKIGDILISNIRPYLKKIWLANQNGGCSSDIIVLSPCENYDGSFVYYLLANDGFVSYVMSGAKGIKMPRGDKQQILKYGISIPSLKEQRKIAALLDLFDQRIETQKKIIEDLKKLKDAIAEKLFCSPDDETPELRIANSSVCWYLYRLKDVCQRISERNSQESSSLVLTIAAQYGLVSQTDFFNKSVASENLSNYYLIQKGDFAYNKSYSGEYPRGAVKRLELYEKGVLSPLYICFRPNLLIVNSDFLSHYFETHKWHNGIAQIAGEGARNHGLLNVSISDYFATLHRLPGLPEQKKIASYLNLLSDKISLANKELQCYSRQKQYLLARMFI